MRVVLKVSGESLKGEFDLDNNALEIVLRDIK